MAKNPPVVMTIAGSDNSAGAGIQADLKAMSGLGVYGTTVVTCVVAEAPGKVSAIQPVDAGIVAEQMRLLFTAFPIVAAKTGMLYSAEIINAVCDTLGQVYAGSSKRLFLVVDPVMVATSGAALLKPEAMALLRERLFPLAGLVTPNLDEAGVLLGRPVTTLAEMEAAGSELVQRFQTAFLLKGGHLRGEPRATDLLCMPDGARHRFAAPFVPDVATHGTGCTTSAAITSYVALGLALPEAVERAKVYVTRAVRKHFRWESGNVRTDALNHGVAGH
jgi:hydroxymethylpyrimidine/phosphomethylpyrimidine kinase